MNDSVFNIVVSNKCQAACPYCISEQTPDVCKDSCYANFNHEKLMNAIQYAERAGIQTCKLTGSKGDPLWDMVSLLNILHLVKNRFPIIELQTNGIWLTDDYQRPHNVKLLSEAGLTIVALSCVHHLGKKNRELYHHMSYPELKPMIAMIHSHDLSVRLSCTLIKGYVDCPVMIDSFLLYFKECEVEQFSFIPVANVGQGPQAAWSKKRGVSWSAYTNIILKGHLLWQTAYGGSVYDYQGHNVYIAECLNSPVAEIRSLIYYPDGHLRYSWTKPGAIIF